MDVLSAFIISRLLIDINNLALHFIEMSKTPSLMID